MQYRKFGKLDWQVSVIGFRGSRFPTTTGQFYIGSVLEDESIELIRYAIDNGINFIDTGYSYQNGDCNGSGTRKKSA
jgi:uncharacterized protein